MNIKEAFRNLKSARIALVRCWLSARKARQVAKEASCSSQELYYEGRARAYRDSWALLRRQCVEIGGNCYAYSKQKSCIGGGL